MPFEAVLYNQAAKCWQRFADPVDVIEVYSPDDVWQALSQLEARVEQDGLYAAGVVSYEAASAFDEALTTHAATDFPLLLFGLFAQVEPVELSSTEAPHAPVDWQADVSEEEFCSSVETIHAAIARGETYQVNRTFPLKAETALEPWTYFRQLVEGQQPDCCGFLQSERWAICSASPELFFAKDGERLTMRPMKGTAPRGRTLAEDRQLGEKLQDSGKNRAENVMILDMVRNDLGRIAPPGEVRTEAICTLEKYPTVWQLTSTATARSGASLADIFRALFPCASITGAPKASTMRIITQVEAGPRDIYTGTFGWIAPGGKAQFNVAIRTALADRHRQKATYGVGAGITWDSIGTDEYRECLDKAAVLFAKKGDFALIETMRWTPTKGYFLHAEHLARLKESAEYFNFNWLAEKVEQTLAEHARGFPPAPRHVRLLLHRAGNLEVTSQPLLENPATPLKLALAKHPVDAKDIFLYHKTTHRALYEQNLAGAKGFDEVVLWNEAGEVTECCTANIVVKKDGRWVTPPVSCGLLAGTYRESLLERGVISSAVLTIEDLRRCREIYLVNALRKWRKAVFSAE